VQPVAGLVARRRLDGGRRLDRPADRDTEHSLEL
jgi:hypothetical protein